MKKNILFLLVTLLCITGCSLNNTSNKSVVKKCTSKQTGADPAYEYLSEYNIYATNDTVDKVEIKETVTADTDEVFNYFEAYAKNKYDDQNKAYGGITYKIDKSDDKIVVNTTMNYKKMDTKTYVNALTGDEKYLKNNKILLKGVLEYYKLMNITCE